MARMAFHPAPGVDVSNADAAVGEVKDPKTFYSVAAPRKTGTMPTVAIVAANDNYPAGYHAGNVGGLPAIDEHLVAGEIKKDTVIFGVTGTFESTIVTTESWADDFDQTVGVTTVWKDLVACGGSIPSTAKHCESECGAHINKGSGLDGDIQLLYNGVQKVTQYMDDFRFRNAWWHGEGLGVVADLKWQAKLDLGSDSVFGQGVQYYQELV